ncbi:LysR substrate-binding domain-containing protein [Neptunomonas sp. XY-337]|uniref:LysR substrate-binding domain-containing protein n=1 Tax=Neptunomonas sp. XY-337 TaxID=2561897 RepID=UPI00145AC4DF|nr:LysR substrate-binding domain-containing protein [Neptunomonas sp. XY-337]
MDSHANIRNDEFDLALFYCRTLPSNLIATPLFSESVFPVCSPAYLTKNPHIANPERLAESTLLSLEVREDWLSWNDWFINCDLKPPSENAKRIKINNYPLVIQSALNGQGLALAWAHLVDDYLASDLLVRPVDKALTTESQFYMLEPPESPRPKVGVELVRDWLANQVEGQV